MNNHHGNFQVHKVLDYQSIFIMNIMLKQFPNMNLFTMKKFYLEIRAVFPKKHSQYPQKKIRFLSENVSEKGVANNKVNFNRFKRN